MTSAELVLDCANIHGEGILWDAAAELVWWTDIQGEKLWSYSPGTGDSRSFSMPGRVCCFAPRAQGGLLLALADGIALFDIGTGRVRSMYDFEPDNPETRLNDGRTDRQGRFIAGGMNERSGAADSTVIRVDKDGGVSTLLSGVSCANSICFSPDGEVMYFADTPEKSIRAYNYGSTSNTLQAPRTLIDMRGEPGLPDGSCVDAKGYVWNAEWLGYRVIRIAPDGRIDRIVKLPVEKPTCCAFGGANLDTLYITSSRLGSDEDRLAAEPQSGGLFAFKPGVRGLKDAPFAG